MSEEYVAAEAVEAPAAPATTEVVAETPAVEEQAEKPEQKPERVFTQRELDKIIHARLTKAENAWERRNREMVETVLRNQPANTQREQAAQVPEGAPDPMKYQNYSDYVRDMARYEARQEQEKFFSSMQAQREQETAQERVQTLQHNFRTQMEQAQAEYEDFEEVALNPDVTITAPMAEVIASSEIGAKLAYHLGKNPTEALRIARMSPIAAARELGKIEAKLTAAAPTALSKAPAPIAPVGGKAKASENPDNMSMEDWVKWREKQLKR